MTELEQLEIKKTCENYLEELDKDPMSGPNCFNADELTLGILFGVHPSMTYKATKEVREQVMSSELYPYYKREVLEIAKERDWLGISALEENKNFLKEKKEEPESLKQTGGFTKEDYEEMLETMKRLAGSKRVGK